MTDNAKLVEELLSFCRDENCGSSACALDKRAAAALTAADARNAALESKLAKAREALERVAAMCNGAGWYRPAGVAEEALAAIDTENADEKS